MSPEQSRSSRFNPALARRYRLDQLFALSTWAATVLGIVVLAVLLADVVIDALPRLTDLGAFLTSFPSRIPANAGIKSALVGSIWVMVLTALFTFPLGVGAGIYLEEFGKDTWYAKTVEVNIGNLAAVPSIIYGLLGLGIFVRFLEPITGGRSVLSGALILTLLILPIVIVATREALRAVPDSLRQGGFALGATRWQVVREHVLPLAFPGILTGTILALSRAIGETAPLITLGALTYIAFLPPLSPEGLRAPFTVLPIQIFNWISRPQAGFQVNAAAGIVVLMVLLLLLNGTAIWLRNKFQQP
jgi:phosphate transport system permease protein